MAVNYKCTSVGCYSYQSPETNQLLQLLQTRINQFAGPAGITPIKVDGIIGKGTAEAALIVLDYIGATSKDSTVISAAGAIEASISTVEDLTKNAQAAVDVMTLAARQSTVAVAPPAPLPAPAPAPTTLQIATTTANAPTKATTPVAQNKINSIQTSRSALSTSLLDRMPPVVAYASGAALAIGTIIVVVLAKKRKAKTAPVAGRWY